MKEQFKVIIAVIFLILFVVFALQNVNSVQIDLFVAQYKVPLILLMLISALVGLIVGLIVTISSANAQRRKVKDLNKEIEQLKDSHSKALIEKDDKISDLNKEVNDLKEQRGHTQVYDDGVIHDQRANVSYVSPDGEDDNLEGELIKGPKLEANQADASRMDIQDSGGTRSLLLGEDESRDDLDSEEKEV